MRAVFYLRKTEHPIETIPSKQIVNFRRIFNVGTIYYPKIEYPIILLDHPFHPLMIELTEKGDTLVSMKVTDNVYNKSLF